MKISFDSKGDFENARAWLKRIAEHKPSMVADQIASEGTRSLASHTPRDTGETAAGWTAKVTSKGDVTEIDWMNNAHPEASVNVAKLIELGHGTGTGGYVPPKPYIKKAMDPIFNGIGDKVAKELIK
jgi:hypothetical protein